MTRRLFVHYSWSYSLIPATFFSTLWNSDVRLEPCAPLLRSVSPVPAAGGNAAVARALEAGATEILFVDVDQGVPCDVLARLRAHDKPIVGALTALRMRPHPWSMFRFLPQGGAVSLMVEDRLQKVDATGCGCLLIQAEVFKAIPMPWFMNKISDDGTEIKQTADFFFCQKAREYGYEVYVDTTLESPHYTDLCLHAKALGRKLEYVDELPAVPDPDKEHIM